MNEYETITGRAGASERITAEVTSWAGVEAGPGRRGELAFKLGRREIGHLHGDRAAHFMFGKDLGLRLKEEGRGGDHPGFPRQPGPPPPPLPGEGRGGGGVELMR